MTRLDSVGIVETSPASVRSAPPPPSSRPESALPPPPSRSPTSLSFGGAARVASFGAKLCAHDAQQHEPPPGGGDEGGDDEGGGGDVGDRAEPPASWPASQPPADGGGGGGGGAGGGGAGAGADEAGRAEAAWSPPPVKCYVELLTLHPVVLNYTSSSSVGFANMQKLGATLHTYAAAAAAASELDPAPPSQSTNLLRQTVPRST